MMDMTHSVFVRLSKLVGDCYNQPTKLQLVSEIWRELFQYSTPPNYFEICLRKHYSHRMLKKTFLYLGYRISSNPDTRLIAWRVK